MWTAAAAPATPAQAFVQLFNLRSVAAVFYLCLAIAASRALGWLHEADSVGLWLHALVRYTRQTLITGLLILLAVALAEAALARPRPPRQALAVRALAVFGAALAGAWLRWVVANWGDAVALQPGWLVSTTLLWSLIGGIAYALVLTARAEQQAQAAIVDAQARRATLQAQQLEAELSALHAQIEPHFLFNTLAHVKRLYETAPERGREMLASLIAYLRAALPNLRRAESTLGQEIELVRSYLNILRMRMGERLAVEIDADGELLGAPLPTLVLPTLVENAIKHGLAPLPEGGRVCIRARHDGAGTLTVEVADDGRGFVGSGGCGVGLANIRSRLAALFGERASLELESAQPRGVVARVRLPCAVAA